VAKGNPKNIRAIDDLAQPGVRIVNRKLGTGTRLLFDRKIKSADVDVKKLDGYDTEVQRHMDVGLAVLKGKADVGPAIQPVADQLGLDFLPWRWERYDLLIPKERFFDKAMQLFLGLLHESDFERMAAAVQGYDVSMSGKMLFPHN
jgi:molybdate-binding protein